MAYFCYLVECADGTFYTGWSTDPQRRTKTHNAGRGARYTRTRRPVKLVYVEAVDDHSSALKRERAIKSLGHQHKQLLADAFSKNNPTSAITENGEQISIATPVETPT